MDTNACRKYELPIFRERLDELRGEMSYADFAEFLGMSRATIGFYLAGKRIPNAADLKKIAQKCHVTSDYLIGMDSARTHERSSIADSLCVTGATVERLDVLKDLFPGLCDGATIPILDAFLSSNELIPFILEISYLVDERKLMAKRNNNPADEYSKMLEWYTKEVAARAQQKRDIKENDVIRLSPEQYSDYKMYKAKQHFEAIVDEIIKKLCVEEV